MSNIIIKTDFYDKEQEKLIANRYPDDYNLIKEIINQPIIIPIEDFKTYGMFRHQCGSISLNTFEDMGILAKNWGNNELYFDINSETGKITNKYPVRIEAAEIPETLGVAGALSVASHIFGFTQADWTKIPIAGHKDFDFNIACSNSKYINIEAKGTMLPDSDNSVKTSSVSIHKSKILQKKKDEKFQNKYDNKIDICLGIITVADKNNFLQSWLVDPVFENPNISPFKLKLLKRLYFYFSLIKFISKRSYLTITLANRIKTIELVSDLNSLNNLKLLNYDFQKIEFTEHSFNNHAHNKDKTIVGKLLIYDKKLYFIGLLKDYLNVMINQKFDEILTLKSKPFSRLETIIGKVRKSNKQIIEKNLSNIKIIDNTEKYQLIIEFQITLLVNSAGLCIGRISL